MDSKRKDELLAYYWDGEPIYHPTEGAAMPRRKILIMNGLAAGLLGLYLLFSWKVIEASSTLSISIWGVSGLLAAFVADFLSGLTHIYIDFGESDRKNVLHKQLFLSRVHHHELMRPAKLGYASLWYYPALYSLLILAVLPYLIVKLVPMPFDISLILPFWFCLLWFSSISQVSHAFAHGKGRARFTRRLVGALQKYRLLLPPRAHGRHHREIDLNFCVLNGWANPLLNMIFKKWIEKYISDSTSPKRQKADMKKKLSYPYEEIL